MLNLFTISTDVYNNYIPFLIKSFDNIKLDFRFILISDNDIEYNSDKHEYIYYHIANLPYPFNTYHKIDYLIDCIKVNNIPSTDSFMYVDVDTVFRKMPEVFWDNIGKMMNMDLLFLARSPFYLDGIPEDENYNTKGTCCHIDNLNADKYVQTSLIFGSITKLYWLYDKCYELTTRMTSDTRWCPKIPYLFEQSIINKIIQDKKNKDNFIIDDFVFNAYNIDIINDKDFVNKTYTDKQYSNGKGTYVLNYYPQIFAIQKFNREIKSSKRL